jgi:HK97 family phage prohead protease
MSTLEEQTDERIDQRPERVVAVRRFETEFTTGDGRTVSFRIAPFGEIAMSADGLGGLPKGTPYKEELMPGLYDNQLRAANRILANFEHQPGLQGIVGHGVELERRTDGYHASFRIHETPDGDKTLTLVNEGVLRAASVESYWLKSVRTAAGVVQRLKAHLEAVAFCRQGAYPGAVFTGLRTDEFAEDVILDEAFLPVEIDWEQVERCRRLGIALPQRMKAHLAETDTPAHEAGTSGGDTRQEEATQPDEE